MEIRKQIFEAAKYITADWCPICEKEFTQADLDDEYAQFIVQYHKNDARGMGRVLEAQELLRSHRGDLE